MQPTHCTDIVFVHGQLDQWRDLDEDCERLGIDGVLKRCGSGRDVWILSPYLRLRQRGLSVRLSPEFIPGAPCVAHRDDVATASGVWRSFCISVRADRDRTFTSNLEVVQSPAGMDAPGIHYIPNWVQPGLVPRDEARGDRLERLGFFGPSKNLAAAFREPQFLSALTRLGIELVIKEDRAEWSDYSDIDAVVAVRDGTPTFLAGKPAAKLINAWHAGVPAFVGSEPAFHHQGCHSDDFRYVTTPDELLRELRVLREDPASYRQLRNRARERAGHLTNEHIEDAWLSLLQDIALPAYSAWLKYGRRSAFATSAAGYVWGLARRRLHGNQNTRGYDYWGRPVFRRQTRRRRLAKQIDTMLASWDRHRRERYVASLGGLSRPRPRRSLGKRSARPTDD